MNTNKKRAITGDFVTRDGVDEEGSWMITDIAYSYVHNAYQARIVKVGNPQVVGFVDPDTLTPIEKNYYK